LEWMKLDISNLVLRLTLESADIIRVSKLCSMGVHSRSLDLLKLWEMSANIPEMIQDRDIYTFKNVDLTHLHIKWQAWLNAIG